MNSKKFNRVVEKRINSIKDVLNAKGIEYESETNRLHNFKRAAEICRCTPEEACTGMQAKHVVSILDLVDVISNLKEDEELGYTIDYINEKIGDAINYFILLEALLIERLEG